MGFKKIIKPINSQNIINKDGQNCNTKLVCLALPWSANHDEKLKDGKD